MAKLWGCWSALLKATVNAVPGRTARHLVLKPVPAAPAGASMVRFAPAEGKHGSCPLGVGVGSGLKRGDGTASSGCPCARVATFRWWLMLSYQATATCFPLLDTARLGLQPPALSGTGLALNAVAPMAPCATTMSPASRSGQATDRFPFASPPRPVVIAVASSPVGTVPTFPSEAVFQLPRPAREATWTSPLAPTNDTTGWPFRLGSPEDDRIMDSPRTVPRTDPIGSLDQPPDVVPVSPSRPPAGAAIIGPAIPW